jgi:hypothetical protein
MPRGRQRAKPVLLTWDGDHFVPHARFKKLCDQQFAVGEDYPMEVVENRSMSAHRGYMAQVSEGWNNLSEENAKHFPSPEHLRKWSLVQCGYFSLEETVLDSERDARKYAAAVRKRDTYAVIRVKSNVVQIFEPRSQAMYGPDRMKRPEFEESSRAVLDLIATMSRTTRGQLAREGRHHGR